MKTTLKSALFAGGFLSIGFCQAAVMFQENFDGGAVGLDGDTPATTTGGASWGAASNFLQDGSFATTTGGSATLAFAPIDGLIYTLDVSMVGVSGPDGDNDWIAAGFANGTPSAGTGNSFRFVNGSNPEGRGWMFARGSNSSATNSAFTVGSTGGGTPVIEWAGPLANANGGDLDFRIDLDTTGGPGNWTVTWSARRPTDGAFTVVRSTEAIPDDINAVGFAISNPGPTGSLTNFTLSSIPEPSSALLVGLGALGLLRRRR